MNSKDALGVLGEAKVLAHLVEKGYTVFTQFSGKAPFDFIVERDGKLLRVEVKSTSRLRSAGVWIVSIRKTRHNRTKNISTSFNPSSCDILAVYVRPVDTVVLIESATITTGAELSLRL